MRVSALYVGLAAIMLLVLALRVVRLRRRFRVGLGDGGNPELSRTIRAHANFVETVPIPLIGLVAIEMLGYAAALVHVLGIALLAGRVAHAQGLAQTDKASPGRAIGMLLTWAVTVIAAVLCIIGGLQF